MTFRFKNADETINETFTAEGLLNAGDEPETLRDLADKAYESAAKDFEQAVAKLHSTLTTKPKAQSDALFFAARALIRNAILRERSSMKRGKENSEQEVEADFDEVPDPAYTAKVQRQIEQQAKSRAHCEMLKLVISKIDWLGAPLPFYPDIHFKDATREIVVDIADKYRKQSKKAGMEAVWFDRIAEKLPDDKKLGDVLTSDQLAELR